MAKKVWNAGDQVTASDLNGNFKYGGTGADGALSVTSGNTNIDAANAAILVKNYSSISITGTGSVTLINPNANGTTVVLKSQGNVTLTSSATPMLSAAGMGALGGSGATVVTTNTWGMGATGNSGITSIFQTNGGQPPSTAASPGVAGSVPTSAYGIMSLFLLKYINALVGSGGGGGGANGNASGTGVGGSGGRGGGGLIIECGGAWNFTTTNGISVAGANATNATHTGSSFASGGGGGSGGFFLGLYSTLTANTGTINVSAGTGSLNSVGNASSPAGAGGGSLVVTGNVGVTAGDGVKGGGDGAAGFSLVALNTEFS